MSELAFDLEQHILRCWNVVEDIDEILDDLENGRMEIHEAVEALRAYQKVYQRRFERCFERFEEYNKEAWAARKQVQELQQNLGRFQAPASMGGKKGKSKQQKEVDH